MKLMHLSDVHIGCPAFVPQWANRILEAVDEVRPNLVVVTGDLTENGYEEEYNEAKEFIAKIQAPTVVVPGNHDSRNAGYLIFEEVFGGRSFQYEDGFLVLLGLDSTEPDIDDGHIGRENYGKIRNFFTGARDRLKILALHHHLIPIPYTGRERHIPVDAGDVLGLLVDLQVDLVLSGHKHRPWVWSLNGTVFLTAGTATTLRLKGRSHPSCNLLELGDDGMRIFEFNPKDRSLRRVLEINEILTFKHQKGGVAW